MAAKVGVEGLAELRKALRKSDRDSLKEVQRVTKHAAEIVAADARVRAPKGTRPIPASRKPHVRLAQSIKATTSGNRGIVRSALPYAKVAEYGGVIRPRGVPITIRKASYVEHALVAKLGEVERDLMRGFQELARRNGWG